MEEKKCLICEEDLNSKYTYTLECNLTFHYECLMKTYKFQKKNKCPYCRKPAKLLPLVNGIKKPLKNIHYHNISEITDIYDNLDNINIKCNHILKKGKNKGKFCNKNSMIGYYKCKAHK